jgi:hypothetical protein
MNGAKDRRSQAVSIVFDRCHKEPRPLSAKVGCYCRKSRDLGLHGALALEDRASPPTRDTQVNSASRPSARRPSGGRLARFSFFVDKTSFDL